LRCSIIKKLIRKSLKTKNLKSTEDGEDYSVPHDLIQSFSIDVIEALVNAMHSGRPTLNVF